MPAHRKTSLLRCALPPLLSTLLAVMPVLADDSASSQAAQQPPVAAPATQPPATPATQPPVAAPVQPATPAPPNQPPAGLPVIEGLKVIPLAGKNEVNDIERKVMAPLVVQIVDQNDRPVESAEVVFRFPLQGPSAAFPGGKTSLTVRTNSQGQAAAMNWMANTEVGRFEVHVNASYGNQVGEVTFSMSNATKVVRSNASVTGAQEKRSWFAPTWVKIAVIGGAVAVVAGVVLATRGGSSPAPKTSTVTISPGSPSIGGPH
jgi:hypothetical protein